VYSVFMFCIDCEYVPFQLVPGKNRQNHDFDETFT